MRLRQSVRSETNRIKKTSMPDINPQINEAAADEIEKKWTFKLQRAPENMVTRIGLVKIIRTL